jgi:hypothetical protein
VEELCAGKGAKGFITSNGFTVFASTPIFAVFALQVAGETVLCITKDTRTWTKADIPVRFPPNQYSLVPAGHALGIDVYTSPQHGIGTLFVSDANGTRFVESLKGTNWHNAPWLGRVGLTDSEAVANVPGVAIVNVVANVDEVVGRGAEKRLRTLITYDDARSWSPIPVEAMDGCDPDDPEACSLFLYPRAVSKTFSGSPGAMMGVGTVGSVRLSYADSGTFISTDAGKTWIDASAHASIYEFGDAGSIVVMIDNEHPVSELKYSLDLGDMW